VFDLEPRDLVEAFDRIGIVAFALSGVEIGRRRGMDLFGLLVMGIVTATGGGVARDLLLTRTPLALENWDYFALALGSAALGTAVVWTPPRWPRLLLAAADALGLGAFAAAGSIAAIGSDLPMPAVIVLAIVTATGGGLIRDLMADRVPLVLRSELNATAAAVGALVVWTLEPASLEVAALAGIAATAAIRIAGLAFRIQLPVPATDDHVTDESRGT
jgi:uncharacterized membrane protein YeiH